jgi:hypothetical protein
VRQIIYLGALGDDRTGLSPHLRSRQEVGRILGAMRRARDRAEGFDCARFRQPVL